jgi:hypothetical protein
MPVPLYFSGVVIIFVFLDLEKNFSFSDSFIGEDPHGDNVLWFPRLAQDQKMETGQPHPPGGFPKTDLSDLLWPWTFLTSWRMGSNYSFSHSSTSAFSLNKLYS